MTLINPANMPNVPMPYLTNVTPFTVRDGVTYLELLYAIRNYITNDIVPKLNSYDDEINGAIERALADVNALITDFELSLAQTLTDANTSINTKVTAANAQIAQSVTAGKAEIASNSSTAVTSLNAAANAAVGRVDTAASSTLTQMAQALTDIRNSAITVQDPVITAILNNANSASRKALNNVFVNTDGKKLQIIAGALRCTGGTWAAIDNSGHTPVSISSVTQTSGAIEVNYAIGVKRVVTFVVGPDQVFAPNGIQAGASVTASKATITMTRTTPISDFVEYKASGWVSTNGVYKDLTWANGVLSMTHEQASGTSRPYGISLTPRGGKYNVVASTGSSSVASTSTKIEFWSGGSRVTTESTDMQVYVQRGGQGGTMAPTMFDDALYPNSNLWFVSVHEVN